MMEGSDIVAAEAIIDNGRFGKRTVRFETGRLAKQAAGSALAYLDDSTTVLSATTVGKNPKDHVRLLPANRRRGRASVRRRPHPRFFLPS